MTEAEMRALVGRVKAQLRVTKVVATRSIKGNIGDTFVGFSAAWNSVQPDAAGAGKDLIEVVGDEDVAVQGMTLQEARVAHYILQQTVDVAALEAAMSSGGISRARAEEDIRKTKMNYSLLVSRALRVKKEEVAEVPTHEVVTQ